MSSRLRRSVNVGVLLVLGGVLLPLGTGSIFAHEGLHELIAMQIKAVEKNPEDALLRLELANLYGHHGDLELALESLDRVDALAPDKFPTDLLRGEAFLLTRNFAKAKAALDRQLVSHQETIRAWLLRARAEHELGEIQASLADYEEALKRTSSPEPDLLEEVAGALADANKKEEAGQVLAAGIEKLGNIPSLILRALDLEIETKNFDAALRRIDKVCSAAPRPEPWMARRAEVLAQAGRIEESRAAWKELLARLESLPDQDRKSRAMTQLTEKARDALASL